MIKEREIGIVESNFVGEMTVDIVINKMSQGLDESIFDEENDKYDSEYSLDLNLNVSRLYQDTKHLANRIKKLGFTYDIYNKAKDLLREADRLYTHDDKKSENQGQTYTTDEISHKMFGVIDNDFWKSDRKVIDPCGGKGNILLHLIYKFYNGLEEKYPCRSERLKHILEDNIYYGEYHQMNIDVYNKLFGILFGQDIKRNVFHGDFLSTEFDNVMKEWGVDKFDFGFVSPIHQDVNGLLGTAEKSAVYQFYVNKVDSISHSHISLIPARFMVGGQGIGLSDF